MNMEINSLHYIPEELDNKGFLFESLIEIRGVAELIAESKGDGVNDTMFLVLFELVFLVTLAITLQLACI